MAASLVSFCLVLSQMLKGCPVLVVVVTVVLHFLYFLHSSMLWKVFYTPLRIDSFRQVRNHACFCKLFGEQDTKKTCRNSWYLFVVNPNHLIDNRFKHEFECDWFYSYVSHMMFKQCEGRKISEMIYLALMLFDTCHFRTFYIYWVEVQNCTM